MFNTRFHPTHIPFPNPLLCITASWGHVSIRLQTVCECKWVVWKVQFIHFIMIKFHVWFILYVWPLSVCKAYGSIASRYIPLQKLHPWTSNCSLPELGKFSSVMASRELLVFSGTPFEGLECDPVFYSTRAKHAFWCKWRDWHSIGCCSCVEKFAHNLHSQNHNKTKQQSCCMSIRSPKQMLQMVSNHNQYAAKNWTSEIKVIATHTTWASNASSGWVYDLMFTRKGWTKSEQRVCFMRFFTEFVSLVCGRAVTTTCDAKL